MTGYTKGPWRLFESCGTSPMVMRGRQGGFQVIGLSPESEIADAHLISAAPDLLEALEGLYQCITEAETSGPDARAALEKAREAIAKARGEV